ncbi:hypothetical protein CNR22_12645 [Sphingobacteriaceae bacterium]|nr:hypothetical protein CNR22_12645 [Sphingobacteriaceae bacterium]
MTAIKLILVTMILSLVTTNRNKQYVIITGDISCKACVIQLHNHLSRKIKKDKLCIALRDRGNIILNESASAYFKHDLPLARYILLNNETLFPLKEKYPYLLSILGKDTLKISYDSLFTENGLYLNYLP